MATQSVKIPVELQIQQVGAQIAELKQALKGVKPDSAAWSKLSSTIEKLEGRFYALERHSKQTFSSTTELKAFKKEFDRLLEGINSTADGFKGLKFKDIKIDSEAAKSIQELEHRIEALKRSYRSMEAISINELIKEENGKVNPIQQIGLDIIPEQYDELIKAINKREKALIEQEK